MIEIEEITNHIERNIGRIHTVFHEIVSDDLHIDVHHVKSTLFRRFEVLVTTGMSARPMAVPPDAGASPYAEVLVVLPKGWSLRREDFDDERNYWPVRLIKSLARFPHHANTWLGFGHTVASGDSEQTTTPLYPSPCKQRQRDSTLEAMTSQRRFRPLFAFFLPATTLNGNQEPTNSSL